MNASAIFSEMIQRTPLERRIEPADDRKIASEWTEQLMIMSEEWMKEMWKNKSVRTATAAAAPTSPRVVKKVIERLNVGTLKDGDMVVEIGPGPGPFAQAVLRETRDGIIYLGIELKERYAEHLSKSIDDSRLVVVNESAEELIAITRRFGTRVRRIISSMPFSNDEFLTRKILAQVKALLGPEDTFLLINFSGESNRLVEEAFGKDNCQSDFFMNSPPLPQPWVRTVMAKKAERNGNGNGKH